MILSTACQAQGPSTAQPNLPNPASVYCEQNGGKLELHQDASGGTAGICVFLDGSKCEEWAYFRGECKPADSNPANLSNDPATRLPIGSHDPPASWPDMTMGLL